MSDKLKFFIDPVVKAKGITFAPPRDGDAGFDVRSAEYLDVQAGEQALISTGLTLAVPQGWVGIVKDRSSMALKGIYTHAGVIDASYRGELRIVLSNRGQELFTIEEGMRIAQIVLLPCLTSGEEMECSTHLGDTERGVGGFGSTGK